MGIDTLLTLAAIFTLLDGVMVSMAQDREGQLPYCAVVLFSLFFLLHGTYHKKCALRLSCRTAAAAAEPYLVTLDEGKWNGTGHLRQVVRAPPPALAAKSRWTTAPSASTGWSVPLLLLACIVFSLLASYRHRGGRST